MGSVVFTSSLSRDLLDQLDFYSAKFKIPKNRIMEKALLAYFERLKKAEYEHSFRRASIDTGITMMAEEGLEDYLKILGEE